MGLELGRILLMERLLGGGWSNSGADSIRMIFALELFTIVNSREALNGVCPVVVAHALERDG